MEDDDVAAACYPGDGIYAATAAAIPDTIGPARGQGRLGRTEHVEHGARRYERIGARPGRDATEGGSDVETSDANPGS